jgi:8-oxo-dGTP pyrophosphatase MutT (NUDIX family)
MSTDLSSGLLFAKPDSRAHQVTKPKAGRFVRLAKLHDLRCCGQVAAVCYRVRNTSIEFLLVRTRGSRRWTFPKGSTEPGLTHAQAAALEAFEEAGVHGRIEETSFARYVAAGGDRSSPSRRKSGRDAAYIITHLCLVTRLGKPKEPNRDRTWFSPAEAKRCLRERRNHAVAEQMASVIDKAVSRIRRQQGENSAGQSPRDRSPIFQPQDGLQKVQFEAMPQVQDWRSPLIAGGLKKLGGMQKCLPSGEEQAVRTLKADVLQFNVNAAEDRSPGKARKTRESRT